MSATMQALFFEMLPIERSVRREQARETAARLVESLPAKTDDDSPWELFEIRFREHAARIAFDDVFASAILQSTER
jgi:hypothetical protein